MTELQKGGKPPATAAAGGVGFMHQDSTKGVPTESTANKDQEVGSNGKLPGMTKAEALELMKSLSSEERVSLVKSMITGEAPTAGLAKAADTPVTHGELTKMFSDLKAELMPALRKSVEEVMGSELQKSGFVPAGTTAPRPGLEKSEASPQNEREAPEAELQKSAAVDFSQPVDIAHKGGILQPGYVPDLYELSRMKLRSE